MKKINKIYLKQKIAGHIYLTKKDVQTFIDKNHTGGKYANPKNIGVFSCNWSSSLTSVSFLIKDTEVTMKTANWNTRRNDVYVWIKIRGTKISKSTYVNDMYEAFLFIDKELIEDGSESIFEELKTGDKQASEKTNDKGVEMETSKTFILIERIEKSLNRIKENKSELSLVLAKVFVSQGDVKHYNNSIKAAKTLLKKLVNELDCELESSKAKELYSNRLEAGQVYKKRI